MGEIHISNSLRYSPDKKIEGDYRFQAGLKALAKKIDDEIVAGIQAQAKEGRDDGSVQTHDDSAPQRRAR